jgi:ferredoxin
LSVQDDDIDGVTVRIEPSGFTITVKADETIMAAAIRQGLNWPTACHGKAGCSLCFFKVLEGLDSLVEPTGVERDALHRYRKVDVDANPQIRLACQARLTGPLLLRKPGITTQP